MDKRAVDLTVVALLQLSALVYGVYVVYEARPVYVVFNVDRFDVVAANEIDPAERKKVKRPEYRSLPLTGPRIVAAVLPADPKERDRILFAAVGAGYDLPKTSRNTMSVCRTDGSGDRALPPLGRSRAEARGS